jgi:hypothetical protein
MTRELALDASAGVVMSLLLVVVSWVSNRAAGDQGRHPTLVAGPLIATGSWSRRRAVRSAADRPLRSRGCDEGQEPGASALDGAGVVTGARCASRDRFATTAPR